MSNRECDLLGAAAIAGSHCPPYGFTDQCVRNCCLTASRTQRTAEAILPMCLEWSIQIFINDGKPKDLVGRDALND